MSSARPVALLVAGLLSACAASPHEQELGGAYEWLPLKQGHYWRGDSRSGDVRGAANYRVEGGDVRTIDGVRVEYRFMYGTPIGSDHMTEKWIYALPASGPREFYVDAVVWSAQFEPPVAVLPSQVQVGATWEWNGLWTLDRDKAEARSTLSVAGVEGLHFGGESRSSVRVAQEFDNGVRITRWFVRDIGMVRMVIETPERHRSIQHAGLELRQR